MRCTPIIALVLSSVVFAPVSARAQVSIEVSKITCDEYVHDKIPTSDVISFPAVGSLVARAMLLRWPIATLFEDNVNKLTNYSYDEKNFKVPVMKAVEQVLGKSN